MRKTLIVVAAVLWGLAAGTTTYALTGTTESPSVTVNNGDAVPNMVRPTELHVQNVTEDECGRMGGEYDARVVLCKNVDY